MVAEKPTREEEKTKIEEIWSSMQLPFPTLFTTLTLYLIEQTLDNNSLHKVAVAITSNEAWSILETNCSEREIKFEGACVCRAEYASVCETKHVEDGKYHYT